MPGRVLFAASDGMELLGIFGLVLLAVAVLVGVYIWERSGSNSKLRKIAAGLKLKFKARGSTLFSFGSVAGFYRGFQVDISIIGRGMGRRRQYFFVVHMLFPEPLGLGLSLAEKGLLNKLGSLLGMSKTFPVGGAKFNKEFAVSGRKRPAIKALFADEVKKQLIRAKRAKAPISYSDDGLHWEVTNMIDVGAVRSAIEKNVPVMAAIWEVHAGESHEELEQAVEQARKQRKARKKGSKKAAAGESSRKAGKQAASGKAPTGKASSRKAGKPKKVASGKRPAVAETGKKKKASARPKAATAAAEKVKISCKCGAVLKVRPAKLGRKARCPDCQEVVLLEV